MPKHEDGRRPWTIKRARNADRAFVTEKAQRNKTSVADAISDIIDHYRSGAASAPGETQPLKPLLATLSAVMRGARAGLDLEARRALADHVSTVLAYAVRTALDVPD